MDRRTTASLLAEGVGTFLFFFVGAGAVVTVDYVTLGGGTSPGLLGVALAHGLTLAILVSAFGAISGAHFNPAVTLGVWIAGGIGAPRALLYVAAQLVGAVLAGFALRAVFPEAAWEPSAIGTPALGPEVSPLSGIAVEAILTAVLLFAVFGTAVDQRGPRIGGLAIALAVAADILMGGPLTGAAMNPARWFGPAVASGVFDDWYVWWVGPALGAAAAALIYRFSLTETQQADVTPATPEG